MRVEDPDGLRALAARRAVFVVPGGLASVTGGNVYDRSVIGALERRNWLVDLVEPGAPPGTPDVVVLDSLSIPAGPPTTDAPVVVLLHQLPSDAERRPGWRKDEAATLGSAALVVAVSESVAARARTTAPIEPVVIPPGWDGAVSDRRSAVPDLVVCVANAHPGKGVPEAVRAYAGVGPVGAGLVLVGDLDRDPGERRRIHAALERCADPVRQAGVLSPVELSRLYARARALLTASRYEGWPIAVAEAMASGVPIAGFDAPGVRDLVRHGTDGLLAPVGDVDALGEALGAVIRSGALAGRMGLAARRRARRWSTWERTGDRFAEELERLVRPPARRSPRSRTTTRTP